MKNKILIGIIFLITITPAFAYFSCAQEYCNFNTTGNVSYGWDCYYLNCPNVPNWINQTNVTVINQTNITVTDCNSTELVSWMSNYTSYLKNITNVTNELDLCSVKFNDKAQQYSDCLVERTRLNQTCSRINNTITCPVQSYGLNYTHLIVFVIAAAIVFIIMKKTEMKPRSDIQPAQGDQETHNVDALARDKMVRGLEDSVRSANETIEQMKKSTDDLKKSNEEQQRRYEDLLKQLEEKKKKRK